MFNKHEQSHDIVSLDNHLNEENRNFSNMDEEEEQTENTVEETYQVTESFFGIMGEYGNNLMVYDTESIILKH